MESVCQCRKWKRHGFDTWVGKIPWRRKWQPTPVFLPGKSHGWRSLAGYQQGHKRVRYNLVTKQQKQKKNKRVSYLVIWEGPVWMICVCVLSHSWLFALSIYVLSPLSWTCMYICYICCICICYIYSIGFKFNFKYKCMAIVFFYFIIIIIILLYNIILVLPYINMHLPWVYTCSPSWTPLPLSSPYHPSGSSQCTSPKLPVSCIEPGLA